MCIHVFEKLARQYAAQSNNLQTLKIWEVKEPTAFKIFEPATNFHSNLLIFGKPEIDFIESMSTLYW